MQREALKQGFRGALRPLILALDGAGATPLGISIVGLAISAASGLVAAAGSLFWAAIVFLLGSALDMLDGDLARLQGTVSRRGAFLDSSFDRLGEAALLAGLTWHYLTAPPEPARLPVLLILLVAVGSLTTSYVRARAEGVGETCRVGFLQRPERVVLLVVGMLLGRGPLAVVLGLLAAATLGTTAQRLVHVARKLPGPEPRRPGGGGGRRP